MSLEARLQDLGKTLPQHCMPRGNFLPYRVEGQLVFMAGQICEWNGAVVYSGAVTAEPPAPDHRGAITLEDGRKAAELCALNLESIRIPGVLGDGWRGSRQPGRMKRRLNPPAAVAPSSDGAVNADAVLQVKVWLVGIGPMVWRRVLVPASFTLRELHGVIRVAMGWDGSLTSQRTVNSTLR